MSQHQSYFKNLREKYSTWDELSAFLQSEDGGAFRIREWSSYAMISYKKGVTRINDESAWLRSVVWDTKNNRPVCVAPAKAKSGLPSCGVPLRVEEFLDGVMVNAFRVAGDPQVYLVSRSQYNASGTFYSKKTFNELFREAVNVEELFADVEPTEQYPAFFASFVLQHPEHRIVYRPTKPSVYLVEAGSIAADGTVLTNPVLPFAFMKCLNAPLFAESTFKSEEEMMELLKVESLKRGWTWQGLVFRDSSGNRWRIRNPTYIYLRGLRGNEPQAEARFLRLRSQGKVSEYLKHYADERDLFWYFEEKLRAETQAVYDDYCSVHKAHEKTLADVPHPRKTLVFKLHSYYLNTLREARSPLQKKNVVDLVNSLPLWEQQLLLKATTVATAS